MYKRQLVAFIIVILYTPKYYFWYYGSSVFSYCISDFGVLLVFFSVFCVVVLRVPGIVVFGILLFSYFLRYCIFVFLYECILVSGIWYVCVLAFCIPVFLCVSSCIRARTRYVGTVVMLS